MSKRQQIGHAVFFRGQDRLNGIAPFRRGLPDCVGTSRAGCSERLSFGSLLVTGTQLLRLCCDGRCRARLHHDEIPIRGIAHRELPTCQASAN